MKKIISIFLLLFSFIAIETGATPTYCFWGYSNGKVTASLALK